MAIDLNPWGKYQQPKQELDISGINHHALANIQSLLERYMPGGRFDGSEYKCSGLNGGNGESCSTNIYTCVGKEFNSGGKGWNDPISLVAAVTGQGMSEAAKELAEWMMVDPYKPGPAPPRPAHNEPTTEEKKAAARKLWEEAAPAGSHAYTDRKFVPVHNALRVHPDGMLLIPFTDEHGVLQSVQRIWPEEGKQKKSLGPIAGRFFTFEGDASVIYIAEGYATAASVAIATGCMTVMCISAGNMKAVAEKVARQHPASSIVFAADNDPKADGSNPGVEAAVEASKKIGKGMVIYPPAQPGNKVDWNDYFIEFGPAATKLLLMPRQKNTDRFKLLGREDIKSLPKMEWVVKGILPSRGMGQIFGPSRAGKSFLSFDMGCAIAEGKRWFGYKVKQRTVVYIMLEGEGGLKQRLEAWEEHNNRALPEKFLSVIQPWGITIDKDIEDLAAVIPDGSVVFVDTQNRAAPMVNENSSEDMGQIIEGAKRLERLIKGVIVLVAHTGKDATKGVRGHSSQIAAVDASIEVTRVGEQRMWRADKVKDGLDGKEHPFRLKVVELGHDEDDEAITSCVIDLDGCEAITNMTGMDRIAIDTLLKAAAKSRIPHEGMWGATVEDWRQEFISNRRSGGDTITDNAIGKSFIRAKDSLIEKGVVSPVGSIMIPHGGSYQDDIITLMAMPFAIK